MLKKIIKWADTLLPVALVCLVLFIGFEIVQANNVLNAERFGGESSLQYLRGDLKSFQGGGTGEELAASALRRGIDILKFIMGGVAMLMGIIYAFGFVFARGKEESIAKHKQNFLYIFIGFLLLMIADQVSEVFNPESEELRESGQLVNFGAAHDRLRDIVNYLKWLFGSLVVLLMTFSGFRLITASGNEEVVEKEKKHITWSGIGLLVILLASNIVNAIYVVGEPETGQVGTAAGATEGIGEIAGIIRLFLVFLGPVAVLFTIYAGFMYLTAFENEERVNKAKRMIVGGVTGIFIIYASFAIVNTLLGQKIEVGESCTTSEDCDEGFFCSIEEGAEEDSGVCTRGQASLQEQLQGEEGGVEDEEVE